MSVQKAILKSCDKWSREQDIKRLLKEREALLRVLDYAQMWCKSQGYNMDTHPLGIAVRDYYAEYGKRGKK